MTVYEKLLNVQSKLKAHKSQFNSFGKYSYRSCEDILESVKPHLLDNKLTGATKANNAGVDIYLSAYT